MASFGKFVNMYKDKNLIIRILIGVALGAVLGYCSKNFDIEFVKTLARGIETIGNLFVGALKAVAPILVFILISGSFITKQFSNTRGLKVVVILYITSTLLASLIGVIASFMFPLTLILQETSLNQSVPTSLVEVLNGMLFKMVDNPINALATGNYVGILTWAIGFGIALRFSNQATKHIFDDLSNGVTKIVQFIIQLAPFGIMGLVTNSVATAGGEALLGYLKLIIVLVVAMGFVAFVTNPLIAAIAMRKNPYPLLLTCLKESGLYAFFTRSSAANIPVNLNLCRKLNLDEELYSISIPLGATINMTGAAVVISILTMCAVFTLGIEVSFGTALLLCFVSALGACGAGGVAGGSLMLIPLATSLFNIPNSTAMEVIAVGFIIGVIQDSVETAINSSADVLYTAVASEVSNK
ncbi:serine/threonine transporter SstT [Campylobacter sp. FMV-PI01]|uniref:Serine/threonine transporter SstT n=1 Tax=Campylobacter portucalensis TaxID=2608384 RepID=A0A6L5WGF3_9BACT|nr:serine/threonine transporter SstT [Campylobacter portucalensis]MSN96049.1 serine/threonine transporter SstT [Campylobacter portucalensis]